MKVLIHGSKKMPIAHKIEDLSFKCISKELSAVRFQVSSIKKVKRMMK